jgi:1-acyl-sn-glycerol-3-phosphate acyltransferase
MFFRLSNQLPMDRSGGRVVVLASRPAWSILNDGRQLGHLPRRAPAAPTGRLYRGKTGRR